jgi:hypothetical protein
MLGFRTNSGRRQDIIRVILAKLLPIPRLPNLSLRPNPLINIILTIPSQHSPPATLLIKFLNDEKSLQDLIRLLEINGKIIPINVFLGCK